jgi:hypothetical protein
MVNGKPSPECRRRHSPPPCSQTTRVKIHLIDATSTLANASLPPDGSVDSVYTLGDGTSEEFARPLVRRVCRDAWP